MEQPQGAVIEIVERRKGKPTSAIDEQVLLATEIRLNGTSLLLPEGQPVILEGLSPFSGDVVTATITMFVRRVVIEHEWVDDTAPDDQ